MSAIFSFQLNELKHVFIVPFNCENILRKGCSTLGAPYCSGLHIYLKSKRLLVQFQLKMNIPFGLV